MIYPFTTFIGFSEYYTFKNITLFQAAGWEHYGLNFAYD